MTEFLRQRLLQHRQNLRHAVRFLPADVLVETLNAELFARDDVAVSRTNALPLVVIEKTNDSTAEN